MPQFTFSLVEVFAHEPLTGNLLPVLHDAYGLDTSVMAMVARRFLQPETSFLLASDDPSCNYVHRIFTVCGEIPFAGHPSLGAAAAHARRTGLGSAEIVQQTLKGRQRLIVDATSDGAMVAIAQDTATFDPIVSPAQVLAAVGLESDTAHPELPAQVVSTGLPALILPVRGMSVLSSARLDKVALRTALNSFPEPESLNCYLVAEHRPGRWRARCFALDFTTGEDPATGSAAGAFGAYLQRHTGVTHLTIDQGIEIGSASQLTVEIAREITVSGLVRFFGEGELDIPVAPISPDRRQYPMGAVPFE
jgi:trans-2,3-dihydro-3-hydroxyanthranilate isomerase